MGSEWEMGSELGTGKELGTRKTEEREKSRKRHGEGRNEGNMGWKYRVKDTKTCTLELPGCLHFALDKV